MTIIESVKAFIETCPIISELALVNVEHLDAEPDSFSIEPVPIDPVIKQYLNGSSYRQFVFVVSSREYYGPDVLQQLENSNFYERFAQWLDECNRNKRFPELSWRQQATAIRAANWGYAFQTDEDRAQYQIQCRLEYLQK